MGTNPTGCAEWERDFDPVTEQPYPTPASYLTEPRNVCLLDQASLFLHIATPDDIEHERQQMEYLHRQQLAVHDIEVVTRSGARCTRVTWQCL